MRPEYICNMHGLAAADAFTDLHKYFDLVSVFIGILNSSQLTIIFASGSDIDFVSRRQAIT